MILPLRTTHLLLMTPSIYFLVHHFDCYRQMLLTSSTIYFFFINLRYSLLFTIGLIRAEENRILFEMCQTISQNRKEIKDAVTAIAEIDVFRAKAKIGTKMRGTIPEVCEHNTATNL